MFLIPAPGIQVRDPASKRWLQPEGREVAESSYWLRRLRSGDVTCGVDPASVVLIDQTSENP